MSTTRACWVPGAEGSGFGVEHLPYGVFAPGDGQPRCGVRIGERVLDLAAALGDDVFAAGALDGFLARGPAVWAGVRQRLQEALTDPAARPRLEPHLHPLEGVRLLLPFTVADYVDFYSSVHHAERVSEVLRGRAEVAPAWHHLPIGYHGRAGTVVVSGTPVTRPCGQRVVQAGAPPSYGASLRLDLEAEVGFVVGMPSEPGRPLAPADLTRHVFGVALVDDWSARDLQAFESVPLGPFLGKSFATSVAAWVTPLEALAAARCAPPPQSPQPLPHLRDDDPWSLDLSLEVVVAGTVVARPPFRTHGWTPGQQLAHLTSNGAHLRTGDLFASGTVSGPADDERGCLLELTRGGTVELPLAGGGTRTWLEDGDEVVVRATAPAVGGGRLRLGDVAGRVVAATAGR